jgi:hypothetical protein
MRRRVEAGAAIAWMRVDALDHGPDDVHRLGPVRPLGDRFELGDLWR